MVHTMGNDVHIRAFLRATIKGMDDDDVITTQLPTRETHAEASDSEGFCPP